MVLQTLQRTWPRYAMWPGRRCLYMVSDVTLLAWVRFVWMWRYHGGYKGDFFILLPPLLNCDFIIDNMVHGCRGNKKKQDKKILSITQRVVILLKACNKFMFWSLIESQSGWEEPSLAIQWNFPIYDLVFRKNGQATVNNYRCLSTRPHVVGFDSLNHANVSAWYKVGPY